MSAQFKAASWGARAVAVVVALALLLGLAWGAKRMYDRYKGTKQTVEAQRGIATATGEVAEGAAAAQQGQNIIERHFIETRIESRERMKELEDEDPDVAAARATPVPLRMRHLACLHRAARDGLGIAEAGCDRFVAKP